MITVDIPRRLAEEITLHYLSSLSSGKLDTLIADQLNEFHNADRLFKKIKKAMDNPMRVS